MQTYRGMPPSLSAGLSGLVPRLMIGLLLAGAWIGLSLQTGHAQQAMTLPVQGMGLPVEDLAKPVKTTEQEIRFRLAGDVLFEFDKSEIHPEAEVLLDTLARKIRGGFPRAPVRVEGHTDTKGTDAYNLKLSQRRAASVKQWLATRGGIDPGHIGIKGFGESHPVAPNEKPDGSDNPVGRQQNRRVEIVVEKR